MRNISRPNIEVKNVFSVSISNTRDSGLKRRLSNVVDQIVEADHDLQNQLSITNAHSIPGGCDLENVSASELINVYTNKLAKKGAIGRPFYDKLKLSALRGICPYCNQRVVTQLDHYLPKASFPKLSVSPVNLIPSCTDCNKVKLGLIPNNSEDEFLHPYFDQINTAQWLFAEIEHKTPPRIHFTIDPPAGWAELLKVRARNYFHKLELADLYSVQAATLLAGLNHRLQSLLDDSGSETVKQYLEQEAESRMKEYVNSWQHATLEAMCLDKWFYEGGFRY